MGSGLIGARAWLEDTLAREARAVAAEAWRAERLALEELDREADARHRTVEIVVGTALEVAGYHRPKRGAWRRRMGGSTKAPAVATASEAPPPAPVEEINEVIARAAK